MVGSSGKHSGLRRRSAPRPVEPALPLGVRDDLRQHEGRKDVRRGRIRTEVPLVAWAMSYFVAQTSGRRRRWGQDLLHLTPGTVETAPVYFACHDAPMVRYQSPNLAHFVHELVRMNIPPHKSAVDAVHDDRLFDVWRKNPGTITRAAALASTDHELQAFARRGGQDLSLSTYSPAKGRRGALDIATRSPSTRPHAPRASPRGVASGAHVSSGMARPLVPRGAGQPRGRALLALAEAAPEDPRAVLARGVRARRGAGGGRPGGSRHAPRRPCPRGPDLERGRQPDPALGQRVLERPSVPRMAVRRRARPQGRVEQRDARGRPPRDDAAGVAQS
jgi:hypothetical protein